MKRKKELDKFYTNKEVAKQTISIIKNLLKKYNKNIEHFTFIEPSAGAGVFVEELKKTGENINVLSYDIEPENDTIIKKDFLNIPSKHSKNHIVIGNPPFGHKAKLAIKFINKSLEWAPVVIFILPLQLQRYNTQKQINNQAKLIYSSSPLPENSFTLDGKPYDVNCIIQIWTRCDHELFPNEENLRLLKPLPNKHEDFKLYIHNNTNDTLKYFDKERYKWDYAVCRQGYYDYNEKITDPKKLRKNVQYLFIKFINPISKTIFDKIDFEKLSKTNTSTPGFSNTNVVSEYIKLKQEWEKQQLSRVNHLTKEDIIKNGSIFTPNHIVKKAKELLKPMITKEDAVLDMGVGYGAFVSKFLDLSDNIIATDMDEDSILLVEKLFPNVKTFLENSLLNISRKKYGIVDKTRLFVIGNPPYNDTTSQYKSGQKGSSEMDDAVKSRDLGISFMKAYALLEPEYVCVLHPLSYLIKRTNFNALGIFKDNYKLKIGIIFSSKEFESINKSNVEFPVVIALYKRDTKGMIFDNIKTFTFSTFNSPLFFRLEAFPTIDGVIPKYPSKTKNIGDLEFYTLRDINALKRNKTFLEKTNKNGIKVEMKDIYKYAWLDYFKHHFNPENYYLYGNLSPLYTKKIEYPEVKKELLYYIVNTNKVMSNYYKKHKKEINEIYNLTEIKKEYPSLKIIMKEMILSLQKN